MSTYVDDNRELADSRKNVKPNSCKTESRASDLLPHSVQCDSAATQGDAQQVSYEAPRMGTGACPPHGSPMEQVRYIIGPQ